MPTTKRPQKKAKRKQQHAKAIAGYMKWLKKHPNAGPRARAQAFDRFVDSSELEEILTREPA